MKRRNPLDEQAALTVVATAATEAVAAGQGDDLIVMPLACPTIPGEQDQDGLRAIAAIDVLRHLVETYEESQS